MASGVTTCGRGSHARGSCGVRTESPSADNALNAPHQLNPKFEAMSAVEIIAHLKRSRRTADFVDAAAVFTARERRLAEAEERLDKLRVEIRRAIEMEMGLRAKIHALELIAAANEARVQHGSGSNGHGFTQQAGRGLSSIEEVHGEEADREVLEDVRGARVTAGYKVLKEEERPARATKKARRQKGPSFYVGVLKALKEKQEELLKKQENDKEAFDKEATVTTSKLPSKCACGWGGGSIL